MLVIVGMARNPHTMVIQWSMVCCRLTGTCEQWCTGQHWKQVWRDTPGQSTGICSTDIAGYFVHMSINNSFIMSSLHHSTVHNSCFNTFSIFAAYRFMCRPSFFISFLSMKSASLYFSTCHAVITLMLINTRIAVYWNSLNIYWCSEV